MHLRGVATPMISVNKPYHHHHHIHNIRNHKKAGGISIYIKN